MPPQLIEITGKFLRERFRFENDTGGDVIIGDVHTERGNASIKGPAELGQLCPNIRYRFFGKWTKYRGENQFSFQTFVALAPVDRESVIAYLANHGAGHGLGKVRAGKLWEQFGESAVKIARTEPETISKFLTSAGFRYKLENAQALATTLAADEATENIKLDLTTLLNGRGFPKQLTQIIIQEWGNRAAEIIRKNPYRLLKFAGCGFKRCDAMYLDLGLPAAALKRQALCAWYSLEQNTDGHTWFGWKVPDAYLRANIAGAGLRLEDALELAKRAKLIAEIKTIGPDGPISESGDCRWFADYRRACNEATIAESILK